MKRPDLSPMANNPERQWIYGLHAVQTLLKTEPERIEELRLQRGRKDQRLRKIHDAAQARQIPTTLIERADLDTLLRGSGGESDPNHQGVAALCGAGEVHDEAYLFGLLESLDEAPLLLVLDEVTDPHNLGACLRSADAAGAHAIVTTRDRSVGITPVVRKVASGAADAVPLVVVTNLVRCLNKLKQEGIWIYGADGDATDQLFGTDLRGPVALVMGAEGKGLRRLTRDNCDALLSLPMAGIVNSLNVSVAAGICLFEARRQRLIGS